MCGTLILPSYPAVLLSLRVLVSFQMLSQHPPSYPAYHPRHCMQPLLPVTLPNTPHAALNSCRDKRPLREQLSRSNWSTAPFKQWAVEASHFLFFLPWTEP